MALGNAFAGNLGCFVAMVLWAVGFPSVEVLLESWGTLSLTLLRMLIVVFFLLLVWLWVDGWQVLKYAPWHRALYVGGAGFGFGSILFLLGQSLSDPVIPAIAAAMMPIAAAAIEVILDKRRLHRSLIVGIVLAIIGGYLATGVKLNQGLFGIGVVFCLLAVFLFAWATRSTTRDFHMLSLIGRTTITLWGGLVAVCLVYGVAKFGGFPGAEFGVTDYHHLGLLFVFALPSFAVAHLLWIWGAGKLGILLASLHMNAVPFYVMVLVVLFLDGSWQWSQAMGAAIVVTGVIIAQTVNRRPNTTSN